MLLEEARRQARQRKRHLLGPWTANNARDTCLWNTVCGLCSRAAYSKFFDLRQQDTYFANLTLRNSKQNISKLFPKNTILVIPSSYTVGYAFWLARDFNDALPLTFPSCLLLAVQRAEQAAGTWLLSLIKWHGIGNGREPKFSKFAASPHLLCLPERKLLEDKTTWLLFSLDTRNVSFRWWRLQHVGE